MNFLTEDYGKVAILVVTYNRINDLKHCVSLLKEQTYDNYDIIIVNNGSTDGTKKYLDSQSDVIVINQENLGGAGGFHAGMRYMYENGYDWLLMMDDDGIPDENELINLLENYEKAKNFNNGNDCIVNALVVNKDDKEELAFSWGVNSNRSQRTCDYRTDMFFFGIHPFNGTLIKRSIIEKIGYVKKEMFIWGDEEEYMLRAKANGFGLVTICSSIHRHPKEKAEKGYLFPLPKKYYILKKPKKLSHIFYRNKGYNYSHYKEKSPLLWKFFLCHFYYNLIHFDFSELNKLCKYYKKGLYANFE